MKKESTTKLEPSTVELTRIEETPILSKSNQPRYDSLEEIMEHNSTFEENIIASAEVMRKKWNQYRMIAFQLQPGNDLYNPNVFDGSHQLQRACGEDDFLELFSTA